MHVHMRNATHIYFDVLWFVNLQILEAQAARSVVIVKKCRLRVYTTLATAQAWRVWTQACTNANLDNVCICSVRTFYDLTVISTDDVVCIWFS